MIVFAVNGLIFVSHVEFLAKWAVNVRFASSFHALCSRHVDLQELLHLADSSPMHRGIVTLVGKMNTSIALWINYVFKQY